MRIYFSQIFYALLLFLLHSSQSIHGFNWQSKSEGAKCIETERQALLKFKQGIQYDSDDMLSTWRDDENYGDCCKWNRVECNSETGHVQILALGGEGTQNLKGVINISSLIYLKNIEYLDLSGNDFLGSQIPKLIGSFTKLRYLNLESSRFDGRIPYELGNLSKLEFLDLSYNDIDGEIPYQLGNLSQLHRLGLKETSLSGVIPFQIGNLPILQALRVSGNFEVNTNFAEWLSNLNSLTYLDLSSLHNLSSSRHLLEMISKLFPNLRKLMLAYCGLLDSHISSLFHHPYNFSTSLTFLDLSSNMLTSSTFHLLSNSSLNLQELHLSYNNIVLSSPLYSYFPSLMILDLSFNNMTSSTFQDSFNFSSKLQELHLRKCNLMDTSFIVSSASTKILSSSLVTLDLSSNMLKSSAIFHWLFNFTTNLQSLTLSNNLFEGHIPDVFRKIMNSLELLDLSYNKLQGEMPSFFGNMCALQSLYLSGNNLSGEISNFFQNYAQCNKQILGTLDLSDNGFTGMLPKSMGLLYELKRLFLSGNSLEGEITESHLAYLSKLKFLDLSYNSLSLKFASSWIPPFQLTQLRLASCKLGPSFPNWLQTQSSLSDLDISNVGLSDSVPEWFWNNLQYVQWLNMSHNNLNGAIPNLPFKLLARPSIILNSNQFEGEVPPFLLQAWELILFENNFSDMFSFLCDKKGTTNLATLDLSNNQIKGQLPDCWKSVNSLLFLDLSNNKFSGKIPLSMGNLVKLEALILRNNSLMGELPSSLKSCSNLIILDVDENLLSGPIPSWIGENMQQLVILSMQHNRLSGNLPIHICYLRQMQLLDLSKNYLSEGIPTCLKNFTAMSEKSINSSETRSHIYWNNNIILYGVYSIRYVIHITLMWKGMEYGFNDPELLLKSIDLSSNHLTGNIPKEFGCLLGMVSLNLSRNNLSGEIPSAIGNLSSLEFVDLSRNHFTGKIPSSFSQIDRLAVLNLSYNSLSGRIPLGRHMQTFDASSFEGNPDLCGEQLNKSCPGDQTPIESQGPIRVNGKDENSVFYEALYMSLGLGYFTGFWGLIGSILLWRPWRNTYLRFLNRLTNGCSECGNVPQIAQSL